MKPSAQFVRSIEANIAYWLQRTTDLNTEGITAILPENENLLRAVEYGQLLPETWRSAAKLAVKCYELVEYRGYGGRWIPLFESIINICLDNEPALKCELLNCLGICYWRDNHLDKALEIHLYEESCAHENNLRSRLPHAWLGLGHVHRLRRNHKEALRFGRMASDAFELQNESPRKRGAALGIMGLAAMELGDLAAAEVYYRQGIKFYRKANHAVNLSRIVMNLGIVLERAGRIDEALICYEETVALLEPTNSELEKTKVQFALGLLHFYQGNLGEAELAFQRANSSFLRRYGNIELRAMALVNLGNISLAKGEYAEAEQQIKESIKLWRATDEGLMLANALGDLARTIAGQGDKESAATLYNEAIETCKGYPNDVWGRQLTEEFEQDLSTLASGKWPPTV